MNRICLIGLGAIGSVYAQLLQRAHPGIFRVILDDARRKRLEDDPLTVNGKVCTFQFAEKKVLVESADAVIVCVKTVDLSSAIEAIRPFVGCGTVILPLLNGVAAHKTLSTAFPEANVLYGLSYTIAVRQGRSVCCKAIGKIIFGQGNSQQASERVEMLREALLKAGIPSEIPADILHATWLKFMTNVSINQVSAIARANYGSLLSSTHAQTLIKEAAQEVIPIAKACGVTISEADVDAVFDLLVELPMDGENSMLQDINAGRKTEVEAFSGTVISIGERHGIPTPVNKMLYNLVRALEEMSRAITSDEHSEDFLLEDLCGV